MPQIRNFTEAREALRQYIPKPQTMHENYTLDTMVRLMGFLGNPQEKLKIIHVAGTSGKTSTCYYLAAQLRAAGQRVGMTVSPHVDEINERVQINLVPLTEKTYCRELTAFLRRIESLDFQPTYFELTVAFAYWIFAKRKVDYAVIEVGLGGLLDGTNVVNRHDKVCVITDIGLDHTNVLGRTKEAIAAQKAGIIHPYNPVFMYDQGPPVTDVVREVCNQQQAELHEVVVPDSHVLPKELPLFQRRNWYLARAASLFVLQRDGLKSLTPEQLLKTAQTYIPARMEIIKRSGKTIILDGAHNAQKMKTLARSIRHQFPGVPCAALLGIVQSPDVRRRTSLKTVAELANHVIVTSFEGEQDFPKVSVSPRTVAGYFKEIGYMDVSVVSDPVDALKALLKRPEKLLIITGSFYLMNHIRSKLIKGKKK